MTNILVIGAGQAGTFSARHLVDAGAAVVLCDLNPAAGYIARFGPTTNAEVVALDMFDTKATAQLLAGRQFNAIVLAAGMVGEACQQDPEKAWQVNVEAPESLARAALSHGVRRFVFLSSLSVYGRQTKGPIAEDAPRNPLGVYGKTKVAAEQALTSLGRRGLDLRILRPCGAYGPLRLCRGSHSAVFLEAVLLRALRQREVTIEGVEGDADEYLYVKDLGRAVAMTALADLPSNDFIFNVSAGRKTTPLDLKQAVEEVVDGARVNIRESTGNGRSMALLDSSRIRRLVGFQPAYDLPHGLRDYIDQAGLR